MLGLFLDMAYPNLAFEGQPFFQRPLVHGFMVLGAYAMGWAYVVWARQAVIRGKGSLATAKTLIVAITASALYGLYQLVAHQRGWPFRGVKYWSDYYGYGVLDSWPGVFRINGLCTEPKQLSMYCVVAVALVVGILRGEGSSKSLRRGALALGILITAFLLTFSGSGLLAITAVAATLPIVIIPLPGKSRKGLVLLGLGLLMAMLPIGGVLLGHADNYFQKTIIDRLPVILGTSQVEPRMEVLVARLMRERPTLVLTGMGAGNYPFMTQNYFGVGAQGEYGISPMTAGWMAVLADLGALGVLGLALIIGWLCQKLLRGARERSLPVHQRRGLAIALVWLASATIIMLFSPCFYILCIGIGLAIGEIEHTDALKAQIRARPSGPEAPGR
jgi:hypothetical protein